MSLFSVDYPYKYFVVLFFCLSFSACAQEKTLNISKNSKLQYCLEQAKKHENMKSNTEEEYWNNLQKAQDFYLCAEKEGDAHAGYKAARLSEGGAGKALPSEEIIRFYTKSANAGNHLAAYALSEIACGNNYSVCSNPIEAKKWLIKAAELGDADILNALGIFYERGYDGSIDFNKAAACYKLAAEKGSELAKNNWDELKKNGKPVKIVSCL